MVNGKHVMATYWASEAFSGASSMRTFLMSSLMRCPPQGHERWNSATSAATAASSQLDDMISAAKLKQTSRDSNDWWTWQQQENHTKNIQNTHQTEGWSSQSPKLVTTIQTTGHNIYAVQQHQAPPLKQFANFGWGFLTLTLAAVDIRRPYLLSLRCQLPLIGQQFKRRTKPKALPGHIDSFFGCNHRPRWIHWLRYIMAAATKWLS